VDIIVTPGRLVSRCAGKAILGSPSFERLGAPAGAAAAYSVRQ
jgi:hypothetical protein